MSKRNIILIVVLGMAVLLSIAVCALREYHAATQLNACIGRMCVIQSAKERYAVEHGLEKGAVVPLEGLLACMKEFVRDGGWEGFHCPSATSNTYTIGRVGEDPSCAIHGTYSEAKAGSVTPK